MLAANKMPVLIHNCCGSVNGCHACPANAWKSGNCERARNVIIKSVKRTLITARKNRSAILFLDISLLRPGLAVAPIEFSQGFSRRVANISMLLMHFQGLARFKRDIFVWHVLWNVIVSGAWHTEVICPAVYFG